MHLAGVTEARTMKDDIRGDGSSTWRQVLAFPLRVAGLLAERSGAAAAREPGSTRAVRVKTGIRAGIGRKGGEAADGLWSP